MEPDSPHKASNSVTPNTTIKVPEVSSDYDESCYPREESSGEEDCLLSATSPSSQDEDPSHAAIPVSGSDALSDTFQSAGIQESMICGICSDFLLDPISLECGHTFCQLCVAHMWKNRTQNCPMCRKPWGQVGRPMPSVNIIFRDLIEHNFPAQVKAKKDALTSEDRELIQSFYKAHTSPSNTTHHGRRQFQIRGGAQQIYCILALVFIFAVLVSMFLVSMGIWLVSSISAEYMRRPVPQWSNNDVLEWMSGLGDSIQNECLDIFEKEKIDGHHLLKLTDSSLQDIGIKTEFVRDSLLLSIKQLDETSIIEPRTFMEFKALNMRQLVLVLLTYKSFPRLTFSYMYTLQYHKMFLPVVQSQLLDDVDRKASLADGVKVEESETNVLLAQEQQHVMGEPSLKQLTAFALEILLLPHLVVAVFALSYFFYNRLVFSLILVHCIHSTIKDVKTLRKRLRNEAVRDRGSIKVLFNYSLKNCITYVILALLASALFHVLPLVILDMFFYLLLFHSLFIILYDYVFKPMIPRAIQLVLRLVRRNG